jgi:hypothetical protein
VGHTGGGTARRRRRGERSGKTVAVRPGGSLVWQEKASSLGSLVGCGSGADGERGVRCMELHVGRPYEQYNFRFNQMF